MKLNVINLVKCTPCVRLKGMNGVAVTKARPKNISKVRISLCHIEGDGILSGYKRSMYFTKEEALALVDAITKQAQRIRDKKKN